MIRGTMNGRGAGKAHYYSGVTQLAIPSHVQNIPGLGDVLFHHAIAVNVATISADGGATRIALILAQEGCTCGCGAPGRGLLLTPDAEGARRIAAQLIARADAMERDADALATAALARARGQ